MTLFFSIHTQIECMQQDKFRRLSMAEIVSAQQEVYLRMQHLDRIYIQIDYVKAMQKRNVGQLYNNLMRKPHYILLDYAVALKFHLGVEIILKYGNPSKQELNNALNIAAQTQNEFLATLLIEYGADIVSCIN